MLKVTQRLVQPIDFVFTFLSFVCLSFFLVSFLPFCLSVCLSNVVFFIVCLAGYCFNAQLSYFGTKISTLECLAKWYCRVYPLTVVKHEITLMVLYSCRCKITIV